MSKASAEIPQPAPQAPRPSPVLPARGLCAHRGSFHTCPENTLPAFQEAIRLGVQMIEFDIRLSRDGALVLMHDETIDRTTDGSGRLADFTLEELRRLDAGSWKDGAFAGTRIPTFEEALAILPAHVWLNCELKGGGDLGTAAAAALLRAGRQEQAFLACRTEAAEAVRHYSSELMICNMNRNETAEAYVDATIAMNAAFIQFTASRLPSPELAGRLHQHGIRVNYYYARTPEELPGLFGQGVDFVLVNHAAQFQPAAAALGIVPVGSAR